MLQDLIELQKVLQTCIKIFDSTELDPEEKCNTIYAWLKSNQDKFQHNYHIEDITYGILVTYVDKIESMRLRVEDRLEILNKQIKILSED